MFVIDDDAILQQVRKQSFDYFIKTAKEMFIFWFEEACEEGVLFTFPVTYISLTFKGFNYEDESLIFSSDSPELVNHEGILNDKTLFTIEEIVKEKTTLSYVYCYQLDNILYIHYEDFKGLIDFKLYFEMEGSYKVSFLSEEIDESPVRFKYLNPFLKDDKIQ
jgi:hypothetical protein